MAIDRALLDLVAEEGVAFLRVYRWDPACLSFGRHEPAARRYDRARILREGIACVRRPTGGRAVWHAREMTYAVAAPTEWFGGLVAAYREIHAVLRTAVAELGGADARLASNRRATGPLAPGACFAAPVGGEVMVGGRKLVGSAQLRNGNTMLQHGSLLLEDDQRMVRDLAGHAGAASETTLRAVTGRPIAFSEAAAVTIATAECAWDGRWTGFDPSRALRAAGRHEALFQDPDWLWHR